MTIVKPNPSKMSTPELLEARNSAFERQRRQEDKEAVLRHLLRCHRPGLDRAQTAEAELQDSLKEQFRARQDLERIEGELRTRDGLQLNLGLDFDSAA